MEKNISEICLKQTGFKFSEILQTCEPKQDECIRTCKRRFWMVFIFSTLSMFCGMVSPLFVSMSNVNMCFYGVSAEAVNWTSLIFMVVYVLLVFPVSWLMGKIGLRMVAIIGSVCNTLACAIMFASSSPSGFAYVMLTSFFGSLSNVFVLSIPPCLAAAWFPNKEVSRACAVGVLGNQLGAALGFIISPLLISDDCENKDLIAEGKTNVSIILTSLNVFVLLLICFTFQEKPKYPPSIAQAEKKNVQDSYLQSALAMAKNVDFVLIFLIYGLIVGTYFAVGTVLNILILNYFPVNIFPASEVDIGWMGLILIVTGLVGSIIAGYILDFTHRFKETTVFICVLSFAAYIVFSCVLRVKMLWLQFVTIGILGFFMTSFLPVGFEYAIEVTYPESEIISAGLLNSSINLFGIFITEISSHILDNIGPNYANAAMSVTLLLAAILSCFVTKDYKRTKKNEISRTTTS